MKKEIERKFLVRGNLFKKFSIEKKYILQGYLNKDPDTTVRVRLINEEGCLTIKGRSNKEGISRLEWKNLSQKVKQSHYLS